MGAGIGDGGRKPRERHREGPSPNLCVDGRCFCVPPLCFREGLRRVSCVLRLFFHMNLEARLASGFGLEARLVRLVAARYEHEYIPPQANVEVPSFGVLLRVLRARATLPLPQRHFPILCPPRPSQVRTSALVSLIGRGVGCRVSFRAKALSLDMNSEKSALDHDRSNLPRHTLGWRVLGRGRIGGVLDEASICPGCSTPAGFTCRLVLSAGGPHMPCPVRMQQRGLIP